MTDSKKPREFHCLYDPETNELTYGHKHGCTDGFEEIHVREVLPETERDFALFKIETTSIEQENVYLRSRVAELEKAVSEAEFKFSSIKSCCNSCGTCGSCEAGEWLAKWGAK